MPDEPQGLRVDGDWPNNSTLLEEEGAEPGRKPSDAEWLSMATADPAYFLKDPDSKERLIRKRQDQGQ